MLAAEAIFNNIDSEDTLQFDEMIAGSWIHAELHKSRNFGPMFHKFGALIGAVFNAIDQLIFRGNLPFTLHHTTPDYACLKAAADMPVG